MSTSASARPATKKFFYFSNSSEPATIRIEKFISACRCLGPAEDHFRVADDSLRMQNSILTRCFETLFSIRSINRDFRTRGAIHSDGRSGVRGVGSGGMVNMSRLSNRVAIVTGASKGIGGGIATALGAAGARVAVNYSSDREGAARGAPAITDNGGGGTAGGAGGSKAAHVARGFQEVASAVGRLGIF